MLLSPCLRCLTVAFGACTWLRAACWCVALQGTSKVNAGTRLQGLWSDALSHELAVLLQEMDAECPNGDSCWQERPRCCKIPRLAATLRVRHNSGLRCSCQCWAAASAPQLVVPSIECAALWSSCTHPKVWVPACPVQAFTRLSTLSCGVLCFCCVVCSQCVFGLRLQVPDSTMHCCAF